MNKITTLLLVEYFIIPTYVNVYERTNNTYSESSYKICRYVGRGRHERLLKERHIKNLLQVK